MERSTREKWEESERNVKEEDSEWSMDCNEVSLTGGHTREPVLQAPLVITRVGDC